MSNKIKILLLIGMVNSTSYALTNHNNPVRLYYYEVNDSLIYLVKGCVPMSDVSFYSRREGGRLMTNLRADGLGKIQFTENSKFLPAFILNKGSANSLGIAGNGMVAYLTEKQFVLKDMGLELRDNKCSLHWKASVLHPERYTFQLLKCTGSNEDVLVDSIRASSDETISYSLQDNQEYTVNAGYRIKVCSRQEDIEYTSELFSPNAEGVVSIYPTVANDLLVVRFSENKGTRQYDIINIEGKILQKGVLRSPINNVNIANLTPGNYFMRFLGGKTLTAQRFVKY